MRLKLENINLSSNSGPNSFASKLSSYIVEHNVELESNSPDSYLCFIESARKGYDKPMFQRLDGIYFNTTQDYNRQNFNIKRTYEMADGVIFQSNFNKQLITKYFGNHKNSTIIHNGADIKTIEQAPKFGLDRYDNLWCCAASWRPHKRLNENIRYFFEHSGPNDGMIIAGNVPTKDRIKDSKLHYVGILSQTQLYSLYKKCEFFVHLAWLDHCPNVVVDARACGCTIICSSAGGTKEIAGSSAIVIQEEEWDFNPVALYKPPKMDFTKKINTGQDSELDMSKVSRAYKEYIFGV
jgi:glycosyltransferase involved in cell wall biosynthesis